MAAALTTRPPGTDISSQEQAGGRGVLWERDRGLSGVGRSSLSKCPETTSASPQPRRRSGRTRSHRRLQGPLGPAPGPLSPNRHHSPRSKAAITWQLTERGAPSLSRQCCSTNCPSAPPAPSLPAPLTYRAHLSHGIHGPCSIMTNRGSLPIILVLPRLAFKPQGPGASSSGPRAPGPSSDPGRVVGTRTQRCCVSSVPLVPSLFFLDLRSDLAVPAAHVEWEFSQGRGAWDWGGDGWAGPFGNPSTGRGPRRLQSREPKRVHSSIIMLPTILFSTGSTVNLLLHHPE